ncbi:hypothetical protein Q428_06085 [Fervidicella metallireducens AeB]|uniref:Flagellar biosynthesis protein FliZ n=1 Tax=Fervidicella metallireducens AeB TaxID=1403537 RepID=A0A017RVW6_9CLOT|nr:flagellar biosynthetic protein FliO [Fervidicella metallireducens]EYE88832.1 hypothetical protein Q428_06085 [Fervidicella metallireducens AeB]
MDGNFVIQLLKLIVLLPLVVFLIIFTMKYSGKYMEKMNRGKIIKIIEKVPLSQNTFLAVVSINNKPYLITNGEKGAQILLELNEESINDYMIGIQSQNQNALGFNLSSINLNWIKGKMKNEKNN